MFNGKPNPGSPEAITDGCTCSAKENHEGKGVILSGKPFGFFVKSSCKVHGDGGKPFIQYWDKENDKF